jgi:hypothetical protein
VLKRLGVKELMTGVQGMGLGGNAENLEKKGGQKED